MLVYQRRQFSIFALVSKQNFSLDSTMHTQLAEALTKQEMNAPIVGKMTPPEVFLGRSEWQGSWNRLRMAHLPREAIYS
jgi:hypothetical protein